MLSQEILRSEVNSLVLPFFALSRQEVNTRTVTEYRAVVRRGGDRLEVSWRVLANPDLGYPGPFDRQVYRAIEEIIGRMRPPIQNPVRLGSLHRLAAIMGVANSGSAYDDIRKALQRITLTGVESKGTYYSKGKKSWLDGTFHLYDAVFFRGEELREGGVADTTYLYLGNWLLDNINARYLRPLDYEYYRSLHSPVASRLYELLGVKFYGLGQFPSLRYRYSTICQLLPVSRCQYLSKAKERLEPAHQELLASGFLAQVDWEEANDPPGEEGRDWYITYWPGERARQERQLLLEAVGERDDDSHAPQDARLALGAGRRRETATAADAAALQGVLQQYGDAEPGPGTAEAGLTAQQRALADQLEGLGVSRVTAEELAGQSDAARIRAWVKAVAQLPDIADVGAYLTRALREGWQPPARAQEETGAAPSPAEARAACRLCQGRNFYWTTDGRAVRCDHGQRRRRPRQAKGLEAETVWPLALARLQQQMTRSAFETRLKAARLLGFDGTWALVGVANEALRQWVERGAYHTLTRALQDVTGQENLQVEVVVE